MIFILETGAILLALGICLICIGYNLTLAGYSRKKMLEGISFEHQMIKRREYGEAFKSVGISLSTIAIVVFFLVLGLVTPIKTVETTPEKVNILVAQDKTVIIADNNVYSMEGVRNHIKKVYFITKVNSYGFVCDHNIMIIYKDQWER